MNLRGRIGFLYIVLIISAKAYAQPSEGYVQKKIMSDDKTWGCHMFLGGDIVSAAQSDFKNNMGFWAGITYEKYITKNVHIGIELLPVHYRWNIFNKKTDFTYPDSVVHAKSRYSSNSIEGALYLRWVSGYSMFFPDVHIDVGAGASKPYYYRYVFQDQINSFKSKTQLSGIGQQQNYYAFVRIGYRAVAIVGTYRFTDVFKNNSPFLEPPAYNIGINIELPDFN